MKKVLITGGAGFIAPHIAEACLKKNWKVVCVDTKKVKNKIKNKKIKYLTKNLLKLSKKDLKNIDFVAHMAFVTNIPYTIKRPISSTYDNIDMTALFLNMCTKANIKKFVFPSTASLYGNNPIPWKESMLGDPMEPYSWQKLSCEYLCSMWSTRYNLKTSIFRLYQVYGENQRDDSAIYKFIKLKKNNKPITLTGTADKSSFKTGRRDFIYVKDIANAFIANFLSKKTGFGEIINVGTGKMTSMQEVANIIGGKVKFIPKRDYEVAAHKADMTRSSNMMKWKPKSNFKKWLKNFVKNIDDK